MSAFSSFSFGSGGFGDGDIFVPGALQNPGANPFGVTPGSQGGGIIGISGGGATSGTPSDGSDSLDWLKAILPFAQLGTNAFLSNQALTSSRPSTVTVLPNGQTVVTGGGAASPTFGTALSSIPGTVWIMLIALLLVIFMVHR